MFHKITKITPLPGLQLQASFENGDMRLYDVNALMPRFPMFESLKTINGLFELVRVDTGGYGVVWNDELDLASEEIWQSGQLLDNSASGSVGEVSS